MIEETNSSTNNVLSNNLEANTSSTKRVEIYTDGSCSGNPGLGGWGAVMKYKDKEREISGYEYETTNNRMELTAPLKALEALKFDCNVIIFTDSKYVQQGITEWVHSWQKNNWYRDKRKTKEVKNKDLWQKLLQEASRHRVEWEWVKGHSNNAGNNRADKLATRACAEAKRLQTSKNKCKNDKR